jgi:hypothetical protein
MIGLARSAQMVLNLLDSWAIGDELVRQAIPQILGMRSVTQEAVKTTGDLLHKNAKLMLLVLSQFQIENALRNVARELHIPNVGRGFYGCAKSVLTELALSSAHIDTLNCPALIRNSLHSNGIHQPIADPKSQRIHLSEIEYEFSDGKVVSCASFEHIAFALECSVRVLGAIFFNDQVLAIRHPIVDQYAWEKAMGLAKV